MAAGVLLVVLGVAWVAWQATSRSYDVAARRDLGGHLVPAPTVRGVDRDARLRPVPGQRVRGAAVSALLWGAAAVVALVAWGITPGSAVLTLAALLFAGDLVAVRRRRRFVEAYERERRADPPPSP